MRLKSIEEKRQLVKNEINRNRPPLPDYETVLADVKKESIARKKRILKRRSLLSRSMQNTKWLAEKSREMAALSRVNSLLKEDEITLQEAADVTAIVKATVPPRKLGNIYHKISDLEQEALEEREVVTSQKKSRSRKL